MPVVMATTENSAADLEVRCSRARSGSHESGAAASTFARLLLRLVDAGSEDVAVVTHDPARLRQYIAGRRILPLVVDPTAVRRRLVHELLAEVHTVLIDVAVGGRSDQFGIAAVRDDRAFRPKDKNVKVAINE